jgi:cellulose synthase/poly-beta-1,6-N-acetylglucosamine synthase-like glycosyltransferase
MRFLLELAGSVLILTTLPGTIELALLTFAALISDHPTRRVECSEPENEGKPEATSDHNRIRRLAVVIPAHNEASTITRCVRSLMQCEPPTSCETSTMVVADNCSDATADLASKAGARVIARRDSERRGKGFALQFAFSKILEEGYHAVLVLDADSVVEPNLLVEVVRLLNSGADGVQARYLALNPEDSARMRLRNLALLAFNVLRPLARDRLGLSCGITGNGFALSRRTLEAVPYHADSIVEDLEYHLSIVRAGRRIRFANHTTIRAEMPISGAAASTQRARWEGGRVRMIAQNVPSLVYESVRTPRLVEPMLELLLLPLAIHVLLLGFLFVCSVTASFKLGQTCSALGLALVTLHVGAALSLSSVGWEDLSALLSLPGYLAWKFSLIPRTLRSARVNTEWKRTERHKG